MTDLIGRADALARFPNNLDPWCVLSPAAIRYELQALPAAQVGVKPLEWVSKKTLSLMSFRFDAESVLGNFSMEYGGWANGKLCLSVPWQDASIWLENDPDAAKAYVHEQVSARIRAALIGGEA